MTTRKELRSMTYLEMDESLLRQVKATRRKVGRLAEESIRISREPDRRLDKLTDKHGDLLPGVTDAEYEASQRPDFVRFGPVIDQILRASRSLRKAEKETEALVKQHRGKP